MTPLNRTHDEWAISMTAGNFGGSGVRRSRN